MQTPAQLRSAGMVFFGCGCAFLAVALGAGQVAFLGVGTAFLGLGVVFLAKGRGS